VSFSSEEATRAFDPEEEEEEEEEEFMQGYREQRMTELRAEWRDDAGRPAASDLRHEQPRGTSPRHDGSGHGGLGAGANPAVAALTAKLDSAQQRLAGTSQPTART
jgi:hypothetical protein